MSYKDYEPEDLARADFKFHLLEGHEKNNIEIMFSGYVSEVVGRINDGKEATVYLCKADPWVGVEYLAAKIYRARVFRAFNTDRTYRNLRKFKDRRMARHMSGSGEDGNRAFHYHWVESEWKHLNTLFDAGVAVPKPYLNSADGILMDYFGDAEVPAHRLVHCQLDPDEWSRLLENLLEDVQLMLDENLVHGDLSAYNILYHAGEYRIIDVPQAIDTRIEPDGRMLLERDLNNLAKFFRKRDVDLDVESTLSRMWR